MWDRPVAAGIDWSAKPDRSVFQCCGQVFEVDTFRLHLKEAHTADMARLALEMDAMFPRDGRE